MQVILTAIDGPHAGRKIVLQAGQETIVGRSARLACAFPLDNHLSNQHFSLQVESNTCRLRDLGSRNGTLVNDRYVTETTIHDGDRIQAGATTIEVSIENASQHRSPGCPPEKEETHQVRPANAVAETWSASDAVSFETPVSFETQTKPSLVFRRPLTDPDPSIRFDALMAAAWTGEKWVLDYCRELADRPMLDYRHAIHLLAILGTVDDLPRLVAIGQTEKLGGIRFEALGTFGHPDVVDLLTDGMTDPNPTVSIAAGRAFTKITGHNVDSDRRIAATTVGTTSVEQPAPDPSAEVALPDADCARRYWDQVKQQFANGTRFACGIDLSRRVDAATLSRLTEEARREECMRAAWYGSNASISTIPAAGKKAVKPERAIIEVTSGGLTGQRILIPPEQPVAIGRAATSGILIADDRELSGIHFVVEFDGMTCRLADQGSRNGTYLNGSRVDDAILRNHDQIHAGQTQFLIHIETAVPANAIDAGEIRDQFDTLTALWKQWKAALCHPRKFAADLREILKQFEAQVDSVLETGEQLVPLLRESLASHDPTIVFCAAFLLLCLNREDLVPGIMDAFLQAEGEMLDGFCDAFCHADIESIEEALHAAVRHADVAVAASAAEALAFQGRLTENPERLLDFFHAEATRVRRSAWRIAALIDCQS